jgi:hypothetical protein
MPVLQMTFDYFGHDPLTILKEFAAKREKPRDTINAPAVMDTSHAIDAFEQFSERAGQHGGVTNLSWPGLSRPSTTYDPLAVKTWMPAPSAGMTLKGYSFTARQM